MTSSQAPAIAIVGPPNSGKTTILDRRDHELQHHPEQPVVHVVKGNPDGMGRYLLHAPEAREALKKDVKGKWISTTAATISEWISNSRNHLEIVLVDLGGKHTAENDSILQHCSHYIALSRRFPDPAIEAAEGLSSWIADCRRNGLKAVAHLTSLWEVGEPNAEEDRDGVLTGAFRSDATGPTTTVNQRVFDALVGRILSLRTPRSVSRYVDLKLPRSWTIGDLSDLGGRGPDVDRMAATGVVTLGGVAPLWAYVAAMGRALERDSGVRLQVFDPKIVTGVVEIPRVPVVDAESPLARMLDVQWSAPKDGLDGKAVRLKIMTDDQFLGPLSFEHLPTAPAIPEPIPSGPVWLDGKAPTWLYMTYARWLLARVDPRSVGVRDIRMKGLVFPFAAEGSRFERRSL